MKKILIILISIFSLHFTSCRKGFDELPVYQDADITSMTFETRWVDPASNNLKVQALKVDNVIIDKLAATISLRVTVPAASTNFPASIRSGVVQSKLAMYCVISNAATIKPVGSTPALGTIGDYTQTDLKYEVIAADGVTRKTWALTISSYVP